MFIYQATRSYIVQTDEGAYRRNRRQIIPIPPPEEEVIPQSVFNPTGQSKGTAPNSNTSATADTTTQELQNMYSTRLRSGNSLKPPEQFDNSWNNPEKRGCSDK